MLKPIRALAAVLALGSVFVGSDLMEAQSATLVQKADLAYQGSFKVPGGIQAGGQANAGFEYGGSAISFNPAGPGLFMVGHDWDQFIGEISIPAIGGTATLRQNLVNAGGGSVGGSTVNVGGTLVYNGRLLLTKFIFYDALNEQNASHFSRPVTLAGGSVTGPTRVGSLGAGFYSGYMSPIPAEWQSALGGPALTGNCCLSIISRTSYGPAAAAFNPDSLGSAVSLVHYTSDHQTLGTYGASGTHPMFNGSTRVAGVIFPPGTASVLFIGTTGVGPYCYGEAAACGDPSNNSKGEHAYPYRGYVWAYNANDLAAVKAGSKQPWQVTPYATWELTNLGDTAYWGIGGATYDSAAKKLYVVEKYGSGELPIVHVYSLSVGSTPTVPAPAGPLSVRIIR